MKVNQNNIYIVIAGLGTVGSSLIKLIEKTNNEIFEKTGKKIIISGICAKNKKKKRIFSTKKYKWFDDPIYMIKKINPNIYIELIGTEKGISYKSIKFALNNKINVVTANKALISNYGNELFKIADSKKILLLFEAAVAGSIPIIKTIKETLISSKIIKISGILNGTTNYILSKMTNNNINFSNAFEDAKSKGYVESNPDLDIEGIDSAHKLSILSSLSFKSKFIKFKDIHKEGITNIDKLDINFTNQLNYVIKLLSITNLIDNKINQYVKPIIINRNSQLANVHGVLNGIQITTNNIGTLFLEGAGAGGDATANSIISDICHICIDSKLPSFGTKFKNLKKLKYYNNNDLLSSFYLRLIVSDKPGVLAKITKILNNNGISIETLIQNPKNMKINNNQIPLVFITHETSLNKMNKSIKRIIKLNDIKNEPVLIQIDKE